MVANGEFSIQWKSHSVWVLEAESRLSARATWDFNFWAVSSAPRLLMKKKYSPEK